MSLIFYYAPMSTATATHWVLEELKVPCEKVKLDLKAGDTKKPDYLKLNPNGVVPALVHDGTAIFESAAIAIYLGETFGVEKGLFPAPGPQRGEALKWIVWVNVTLGGASGRYHYAASPHVPAEQHNAAAAAAARADVERYLGILDAALAGKTWLLGDAFSVADAHVAAFAAYMGMTGFDLKKYANLSAWTTRATARPAFAAVMAP
jgi:glutathione S-transferase